METDKLYVSAQSCHPDFMFVLTYIAIWLLILVAVVWLYNQINRFLERKREKKRLLRILEKHQRRRDYTRLQHSVARLRNAAEDCSPSGYDSDFSLESTPEPMPTLVEIQAREIVEKQWQEEQYL